MRCIDIRLSETAAQIIGEGFLLMLTMQYTGLKDKNGVEIYEGDIVQINQLDMENQGPYVVEFEFVSFLMRHKGDSYYMSKLVWASCEVIGNIQENPELLKNPDSNNKSI